MNLAKGLLAGAVLLAASAGALGEDSTVGPPARNWVLPLFTKEGYRQMTLRGDEVHPVTSDRVDITGMNITVFSGLTDTKIDSVILSPQATFLINEKIARGDGPVRLVRDDIDVSGQQWTYYYSTRKVVIARDAHVVFHAPLPDILK